MLKICLISKEQASHEFNVINVINVISEQNASHHIMVERFRLTSTEDFIKSFGVLMASFYVFNIEYTKKVEGSFIFVRKLFLKINGKQKTPQKALFNIFCLCEEHVMRAFLRF